MPTEQELENAATDLLKSMKATATQIRDLIVAMPDKDLLGYIYAQYLMKAMGDQGTSSKDDVADSPEDILGENQFLLEYVHAVLASDAAPASLKFDEAKCIQLFELSRELKQQAMIFAMATSDPAKGGIFGPNTGEIEFHAKTTWIMLRGNRYQVLEGEFYDYVLAPHDDVLKEAYGVGSAEIAAGFQDMANASRSGQANAIEEIQKHQKAAIEFAMDQNKPLEEVMESWVASNVDQSKATGLAIDDLFRGGIANVSRHTQLPNKLLADLAYERGEETEFFASGDYAGTPYQTLPARKKPLIKLGSDYYAVDPCFTRDAGYRALLFNLLKRKPEYRQAFENRQKILSEGAFSDILAAQLPNATVHQEVYYKDPTTKQWSENDTVVLLDDVLFLIEAKAGAAATIASPALDFGRHAQSVQDLVIKAYKQCERFFNYLNSADEVPIYHLVDGKYRECGRIRQADYRIMVPIGLTVESFSPFSTYCKELPQIEPLLGKHAFISMSIDDLFVLKRILPTPGEFAHYIEVRQAAAGIRRARLFDEFDHLGAYLTRNRFDQDLTEQLKGGEVNMLVWDGMSDIIDKSFEGENWESKPIPSQNFPEEVTKLLGALNTTRASGWLSVESHIRDFGDEARKDLAKILSDQRKTLDRHPARYFIFTGDGHPLFVWLQSKKYDLEWGTVNDKASAAALAINSPALIGLVVIAGADGTYNKAERLTVHVPSARTNENAHIYDDAKRMKQPNRKVNLRHPSASQKHKRTRKIGRNEPCPCGSGVKYKKCHGR